MENNTIDKSTMTYQMSEFNNHIKVNQAIKLLQSLTSKYNNNDETIDGETMEHIIDTLGFDEYLYKKYMNKHNIELNGINAELI